MDFIVRKVTNSHRATCKVSGVQRLCWCGQKPSPFQCAASVPTMAYCKAAQRVTAEQQHAAADSLNLLEKHTMHTCSSPHKPPSGFDTVDLSNKNPLFVSWVVAGDPTLITSDDP